MDTVLCYVKTLSFSLIIIIDSNLSLEGALDEILANKLFEVDHKVGQLLGAFHLVTVAEFRSRNGDSWACSCSKVKTQFEIKLFLVYFMSTFWTYAVRSGRLPLQGHN